MAISMAIHFCEKVIKHISSCSCWVLYMRAFDIRIAEEGLYMKNGLCTQHYSSSPDPEYEQDGLFSISRTSLQTHRLPPSASCSSLLLPLCFPFARRWSSMSPFLDIRCPQHCNKSDQRLSLGASLVQRMLQRRNSLENLSCAYL